MKRFDTLRTIQWIVILVFGILLISKKESTFANAELIVNLKDGKAIYKNQLITADMFEFRLGNKTISDVENMEITPKSFEDIGEQCISVVYKDGDEVYMKKLMVSVETIVPSCLTSEMDTVRLITGQEVTKEQLPSIYLHYNNGEQTLITEYSFMVDWENKNICISYDQLQTSIAVEVIDNKMDYLEVNSRLKGVPENYIFDETDIAVTLHYTNGTKEMVTDYQIMPYKLIEGCESFIYVTYKEMTAGFKVMATKEIIEATPLPEEQQEDTILKDGLENLDSDGTAIPEKKENLEPEHTADPEMELADGVTPSLKPSQEHALNKLEAKDTKPPKTNIKNKTYTKEIKICATDESEIATICLQGSINKIVKNGYKLRKEGKYRLILTDIYGNTKTVNFKLQKPVKKIEVSYLFTSKWNRIKFSAKVTGTNRAVKWSVSDKKIATVDQNGNFKAKKSGTVYLVAKLDKKKVKQKIKIEKKKKSILLY